MNKIIVMALLLGGCAHVALPSAGGQCSPDFPIKGNADSSLYHTPESPYYAKTYAEVCFASEESARQHGFAALKR